MKGAYYSANGVVTHRTLDIWQSSLLEAKQFYLFEDSFDKLNWEVNPEESYDALVARRCKSIANKYKKIRLWYSAGRDSHCVLLAMIQNNIHIDELVFVNWQFIDSCRQDDQIVIRAIKNAYANSLLTIPNIRIFTPEHKDYLRYWSVVGNQQNSGGLGSNYEFNINSFSALLDTFQEFEDEDMCNLFGLEKPRLVKNPEGVFFQMVDSTLQHVMSPKHNIEWFFLNDTVPELVVKQCHMLLNGARVLAIEKFNNDLATALEQIQTNESYYDRRCMVLGLGPAVSLSTGAGTKKNFGFNKNKYHTLYQSAEIDYWDAQKYYKKFYHSATDLITKYVLENQVTKLPGLLSKPYKVST
jgi:hypothetical protein